MTRALLTIVSLGTIAGLSAPAHAAQAVPCDRTYGGDMISATNVGCVQARDLVRTWAVQTRRTGEPNRKVRGFTCRLRVVQVEGETMRCARRGDQRVTWYVNLPR